MCLNLIFKYTVPNLRGKTTRLRNRNKQHCSMYCAMRTPVTCVFLRATHIEPILQSAHTAIEYTFQFGVLRFSEKLSHSRRSGVYISGAQLHGSAVVKTTLRVIC